MYIDLTQVKHMEFENVDMRDYPDFCDAYLVAAYLEDGTELTEEQIDYLNAEHWDFVNENVYLSLC